MKNISVRLATINDLKKIQEFQVKMEHHIEKFPMPDALGVAGVEYILSNPNQGFYIVAELKNVLLGCLGISFERSVSSNGFFWWIQNVFVDEGSRGNGVFQILFDEVLKKSKKSKDVVSIKLHVHINNPSAIKAYEKAGMKRSPEYPYIYKVK